MVRRATFGYVFALLIAGLQAVSAQAPAPAASGTPRAKNDYNDGKSWLCRPGREDACTVDLTTTVVAANGVLTKEAWAANPNAPIDCFYVYPTVSLDATGNSDMIPGPEEQRVAQTQLARFASQCRPYAPMYRQFTLVALRAAAAGKPIASDRTLAYADVVDAWKHYLEHDNKGRGVVLIGHSQGSGMLVQLIRDQIDGKPVQSRLVSALLLGTNVAVPAGKDVGGAFTSVPLCRSASQTGCVISYVTFRSNIPPPADSRFGRVPAAGQVAACTNPAALGGGTGPLHAYLSSRGSIISSGAEPRPWVTPPAPIATPYVSVPGLLTAQCVSNEKGSYLEVTVNGNPADPRTDEISGDVMANGQVNASWGLHLIDVNVAMGNLVDIVSKQAKAFTAGGTRR